MSERWEAESCGRIGIRMWTGQQIPIFINAITPLHAQSIVTAVNNHEPLVKMLDIALDAIGDAMDAGVTMGGISPETFQEGRVLLADIDKEAS